MSSLVLYFQVTNLLFGHIQSNLSHLLHKIFSDIFISKFSIAFISISFFHCIHFLICWFFIFLKYPKHTLFSRSLHNFIAISSELMIWLLIFLVIKFIDVFWNFGFQFHLNGRFLFSTSIY